MTGLCDCDSNQYLCLKNCHLEFRSCSGLRIDYRKPRKHQYEENCRTGALVNKLQTTIHLTNPTGLMQRLLHVLWSFFSDKYNELVSATWS